MSIKVLGRRTSANVQKVVWTLEEIGEPYELTELGGKFGGLDTPAYRDKNPNGLVPTIEDGGLTLWESNAIVRYLSGQYASGLLFPVEPAERALADQWADWCASTFQPVWSGVFYQAVRVPVERRDAARLSAAIETAAAAFALVEQRLAASPWLGGKDITYADIIAGVSLFRWFTMEIDRPSLPRVEALYERLQGRPAFVKAVMVDYSDLRGRP